MVDTRAGRVLEPGGRHMVDAKEWDFIERNAAKPGHDHVLIGASLPWLLAPAMHHMEAWNEAVCDGAWGRTASRVGERIRQGLDLEHWAAFQDSFRRLAGIVEDIGSGRHGTAPSTIVALSGDVHHAYLAEVGFRPAAGVSSRVYQAVCSPFRNPLDTRERRVIKTMFTRPAGAVARALARAAGVEDPPIRWTVADPPVFDNVVATLRLHGPEASIRIERARPRGASGVSLETVFTRHL
jgi:hypothetical protein